MVDCCDSDAVKIVDNYYASVTGYLKPTEIKSGVYSSYERWWGTEGCHQSLIDTFRGWTSAVRLSRASEGEVSQASTLRRFRGETGCKH